MGELIDQYGNKENGYLIRSDDWNGIVAAIETLETNLTQEINDLSEKQTTQYEELTNKINVLDTRITQVEADLAELREEFEPFITMYYRLELQTTKVNYAIGEFAQITARVTDLKGNPLHLTNTTRPWVDFVATWGQLKAVAGYESRSGADTRALSVRTDLEGVAKVVLRSEFVKGLTDEAELDVESALQVTLPDSNMNLAQGIIKANTPLDAKNTGVFKIMSTEYERSDAVNIRHYVDTHYLLNPDFTIEKVNPGLFYRWRDYRSTVMAFVKNDADPTTPDQSRGVSSMQVTFRDWISPWIILDYFDIQQLDTQIQNTSDLLISTVTGNFNESIKLMTYEVGNIVRDTGVIGRMRDYSIIRTAIERLDVPQPPIFMNTLTQTVLDAINIQQVFEGAQAHSTIPSSEQTAFKVFTNAAARTDTGIYGLTEEISTLKNKVDQVDTNTGAIRTDLKNLQGNVSFLGGRLDETLAEGGRIKALETSMQSVSGQVEALIAYEPTAIQTNLANLSFRLATLEGSIVK